MNRVGIIKRSGFANLGFGTGAMRVLLECLKHHNVEVIKLWDVRRIIFTAA